ncbi:MAG: sodium ion-translocating decarboxylase subunit beta [Sumerlaeia bacterium]
MLQSLLDFLHSSGFGQVTYGNVIMIAIGGLFIFLAIKKGFEPLLLVPIGFGMLIGNIPYDASKLSLSVYDGPVNEDKITYVTAAEPVTIAGETYGPFTPLLDVKPADKLVDQGKVLMTYDGEKLRYPNSAITTIPSTYHLEKGGHTVFVAEISDDSRYPIVIEPERQNIFNASVLWILFRGIEWGFFPPLIFLGVGALIDFGPLLSNPKTLLLGAAAQFGIFGALFLAVMMGFDMKEAASIGIIGGADGPTAIFTCTMLAPHLLGAVALAAYSYMAMVPIIQPPIMKLLTTKAERKIRMEAPKHVPRIVRIMFPVLGFLLTAFIANGALPLLGMLFFGNLLRESMVTERLSKTASNAMIDIVTILLGVTVGAKTQASNFLTVETLGIFVLGIVAFAIATATGVLAAKLMNAVCKEQINPLIGAAGVSAVPMSARVVHRVAQEEDPQNFLLMHAMGPNVAGVIGSALAAGVLLSTLS